MTTSVALASFPRSGNTWLRVVIEDYTGEASGSIYRDRVLPRSGEGIVVKTHNVDRASYAAALHIVRDPFDAIASYFAWRRDIAGQGPGWSGHVEKAASRWSAHCRHWTSAPYEVCLLRYEDMVSEPEQEFTRAFEYLGVAVQRSRLGEVIDRCRIDSLRERFPEVGERFFRRGTPGAGRADFTGEQAEVVSAECRPWMERFGY